MITSIKSDGDMKQFKNIRKFCTLKNINYSNLTRAGQVHGKDIKIVDKKDTGKTIKNTDGLITKSENIYLAILTADCLPVSFSSKKICGILHVGWRGLAGGIIENALNLISKSKEDVSDICFNIGPGISSCHFEVKKEVLNSFNNISVSNFIDIRDNKYFLDIKKIAYFILKQNGVEKIKINNECTFCDEKYFSYRRDKKSKRMISIINIH